MEQITNQLLIRKLKKLPPPPPPLIDCGLIGGDLLIFYQFLIF